GGVTPGTFGFPTCDCLNSPSCPSVNTCSIVPKGSDGSIIFQETSRDLVRYYNSVVSNREIAFFKIVSAHELGHQFGLKGDNVNSLLFQIMDYPNYDSGINSPTIGFNAEHLNILRK